jgi:Na+/H+ antiporter NhaD/arsenite permease-like protein
LVGDVVEPFHDADDGIIRATRSDKIKGAICFALMFALTIVTAAWETHLDKESFLRTPVGMACVTECEGDIETRDFLNGHYHFKDGEVLDMFMHVDANSPAAEAEEHIFADIVGADTGNLKATVKFGDVDEEERKTYEKRVTVDFENPEEAHVINVRTESGGFEVSFTLAAYVLTPLAQYSELIGLLIMIVVYILILIEVIHRTLVAVFGSMVALMFFFVMSGGETESIERIMMHQEWSTLGLLFGMMLIVGELSHTGIFEFCAVRLLVASKGSFIRLVILLCTLTAVASAFLDNVTTMLLVAPVTIDMCSILEVDPRPYLIGEVLLSNIGGTATMIGDPPNIIIGSSFEEIGFVDFVINVLPCIFFFCIPVSLLLVVRIYRHYFSFSEMKALDTAMLKKTYPIYDEPRLMIAGTVTFFVIVMFFLHPVHHKDTAWIALLGAFITIAFTNPHDVQDALRNHVEWDTLLFFAGLFVLVEVVAAMGLLDLIGEGLATFIEGQEEDKQLPIAITLIIWVSAITSAFLDNIPYTATMIPIIQILADSIDTLPLETLAWALSFGACLGGNGTLLGASANIVTSGIATSKGYEISFLNFTYPGMIVMFVTVAIANLYMLVVFVWV